MAVERQVPQEFIRKPSDSEVGLEQGAGVEAVCRMPEISEWQFHRRRHPSRGLKGSEIRR